MSATGWFSWTEARNASPPRLLLTADGDRTSSGCLFRPPGADDPSAQHAARGDRADDSVHQRRRPSGELFAHPLHPCTRSLLSAIPPPDPHCEKQRRRVITVPEKAHDCSVVQPELRKSTLGHFMCRSGAELDEYRRRQKPS